MALILHVITSQRKSFLEKKGIVFKDGSNDEDNNDEESFMVLDSVGSADGSYFYYKFAYVVAF